MEEGKLFLSVTVLYCHDYLIFFSRRSFFRLWLKTLLASYNGYERDISKISLIVDDCLWFHSVIQTGYLPSFRQILQIPMSSLLTWKIRVRLLFMYFFFLFFKSVLLGGFSLEDRQLYLLHAFTPISGSGLKPQGAGTICLCSRLLFYSKCSGFTVCLTYSDTSLTMYINQW